MVKAVRPFPLTRLFERAQGLIIRHGVGDDRGVVEVDGADINQNPLPCLALLFIAPFASFAHAWMVSPLLVQNLKSARHAIGCSPAGIGIGQ